MAALVRQLTRKGLSTSFAARHAQLSSASAAVDASTSRPFSRRHHHHHHHLRNTTLLEPDVNRHLHQPSPAFHRLRRRHFTANPTHTASAASAASSAAAGPAGISSEHEEILQSIVKVFTVSSSPNFFMPWQNKTQSEKTGSGVVSLLPLPDVPNGIGVLTNAHVVSDQTFVQVRRHGSSVKYQARVYAVGHDCDLAVLTVDDPTFFADSTAIAPAATANPAGGRHDDGVTDTADATTHPTNNMTTTPETQPATATGTGTGAAAEAEAVGLVRRQVRPPPMGEVPNLQARETTRLDSLDVKSLMIRSQPLYVLCTRALYI